MEVPPQNSQISGIDQVVQSGLCAGCGACSFLQPDVIRMEDDLATGRRPVVEEGAMTERALAACPGVSLTHDRASWSPGWNGTVADDWGPVLSVWEGHAVDDEIRHKGSSGGAATALALWSLEKLGNGGVLHSGADPDRPYLNRSRVSRSREELLDASGSRYAPASPCDGLQHLAGASTSGTFIGKPCDVAGASMAAKLRPDLQERLSLTIAIFCAGAPSTNATLDYVAQHLKAQPHELGSVRYRGNGWPGEFVAMTHQGATFSSSYAESWGQIQAGRPWRCRICPDHSGEFADVSVGDPWYRPPVNGEAGRSLVIARTERGHEAVRRAIEDGYLALEPVDASVISQSQQELMRVRAVVHGRVLAMRLAGLRTPRFVGLALKRVWQRDTTLLQRIKTLIGTWRRLGRYGLQRRGA